MESMALEICHFPVQRQKPVNKCYTSLSSNYKASSSFNTRIRTGKPGSLSEHQVCRALNLMGSISTYPQRKQREGSILKCSCSWSNQPEMSDSSQLVELPLLRLPLVLFPGVCHPIQIFEFRYRIMMHTLLQGNLRFGIIYSDSTSGTVNVGCVGQVVKHEKLVDDRFFLICKGQERFRVVNLVRTKPYLVAEVQWLEDCPCVGGQQYLESLAFKVETCMKDVIRLSNKLNRKPEMDVKNLCINLPPTPFSFIVGSILKAAPKQQQALLEMEDTAKRLEEEHRILRNSLNYLVAASAIEDAFQYPSFNEN